ncbi:hypothetical protein Tsubulata_026598 [Turnera subulata]|uniref:Uncharacterized protein n=1 Tax=Turnera subulata TaxID=218843 RepID=A0A9Q0FYF5_9ROSI|nr:hypothetical protein Tsubulata_026598 [Turnera subulata]
MYCSSQLVRVRMEIIGTRARQFRFPDLKIGSGCWVSASIFLYHTKKCLYCRLVSVRYGRWIFYGVWKRKWSFTDTITGVVYCHYWLCKICADNFVLVKKSWVLKICPFMQKLLKGRNLSEFFVDDFGEIIIDNNLKVISRMCGTECGFINLDFLLSQEISIL